MQVVICYRNESSMEELRRQVEDFFCTIHSVQLTVCTPGQMKELLGRKTFFCDILLIDFEKAYREESFKVIEEVEAKIPTCQLICYSPLSDINYYPKLFEKNLCYYLCEEQLGTLTPTALKLACEALEIQEKNCLICKSGYQILKVFFDDIVFIERDQHTTRIHTKNCCYSIKEKLSELEDAFQKYPAIVRCHMSFYVNCRYAVSFSRKKFDMVTGESIPISRKYYKQVSDKIYDRVIRVYNQSL